MLQKLASKNNNLVLILLIMVVGYLSFETFQINRQQRSLHGLIDQLEKEKIELQSHIDIPGKEIVREVVKNEELWSSIQDRIRNSVVQVFVQVAEQDLLQPYKTPSQCSWTGSGFFIDQDGHIITNAHVVNQSCAMWIQIPEFGRRIIDVELVGLIPDRDLALLRLTSNSYQFLIDELGQIPVLPLGNSDELKAAQATMAVGYPLSQEFIKCTDGMISGWQNNMIQISAPINPGSSGGPLLNTKGEVVGINSSGFMEAQNVGYAIPVNDLKIVLPDLKKVRLLRKPFLGVLYGSGSEYKADYFGNPSPSGCYVYEVVKNSMLAKAGLRTGDMIYEINGFKVDAQGDIKPNWGVDKMSIVDYVSRLSVGHDVKLVVYRAGKRINMNLTFDYSELPSIRSVYPGYEPIDYEVFGGMVIQQLTLNHIKLLRDRVPGLLRFAEMHAQSEPHLVITHIFPSSQLYRLREINVGATLNEVNGKKVSNLEDFRAAIKSAYGQKYLTIRASDNIMRISDNMLAVLPMDKILKEEPMLARDYHYQMTATVEGMVMAYRQHLQESQTATA